MTSAVGGPLKNIQKEQNQLICDSDKGGEGVKNSEHFEDILYGSWLQWHSGCSDSFLVRNSWMFQVCYKFTVPTSGGKSTFTIHSSKVRFSNLLAKNNCAFISLGWVKRALKLCDLTPRNRGSDNNTWCWDNIGLDCSMAAATQIRCSTLRRKVKLQRERGEGGWQELTYFKCAVIRPREHVANLSRGKSRSYAFFWWSSIKYR